MSGQNPNYVSQGSPVPEVWASEREVLGGGGSPIMASPVPGKKKELFPVAKWQDVWAAILFYLQLLAFVGIGIFLFVKTRGYRSVATSNIELHGNFQVFTLIHIGVSLLVSMGSTALAFMMMKNNGEVLMHVAMLFNPVICIVFGVFAISNSIYTSIGAFMLSLIQLVWYFVVRKRIPFSAVVLRFVINCTSTYPAVFTLVVGALIVSFIYLTGLYVFSDSLFAAFEEGLFAGTPLTLLIIFFVLSICWTIQVIWNVSQTSIAGVFATFYFTHGSGQRVKGATIKSLKRAVTYSFGSICFGSLIVAIIQTIRFIFKSMSDEQSLAGAIFGCLLEVIESLIRYFNSYAYTQIAIYGKPFIRAAQDTWDMLKRTGIEAVINDDLIGTVCGLLAFGSLLLAASASCFINYFIYKLSFMTSLLIGLGFSWVAVVVSNVGFTVVTGGATALFVCMAEEPEALRRDNPQLYNEIQSKYGNILPA